MLSGCGSKEEQVAVAPSPQDSQAPAPQAADGNVGVEEPSSDPGDVTSEPVEDGTEAMVEEAPADDESTAMANEDGEAMAENGTVMENEDGTAMEDENGVAVNPNAPPPKPKTLREQADQAFASGHEKAALRLLQAHLLATPTEAAEILSNYRWSPMRKQPQMLARVAVGVDLENPHAGLKTLGPIGSIKKRQSTRVNRNPEEDGLIGSESLAATFTYNNKERALQKFTGLMGDSLVQHVRETHQQGMWSPYFKSNLGVLSSAGASQANAMVAAAPSEDGSVEENSGDENESMTMAPNLTQTAPLATKIVGSEAKYISVGPTLSFLGAGKTAKLHEFAKEGGFDALIVFDVKIDINLKVRLVYNTCQAKLFTIGDTKPIAASKSLKNTEAQTEIDKTGMAYVDKAMQTLNAALDARVSLTEIPGGLTSELIKTKRLPVILADTARSKLETLCEIRLYREKGFLTDEDVATSFATLLGADSSKKLLGGSDAERLEVVQKLLDASAGR